MLLTSYFKYALLKVRVKGTSMMPDLIPDQLYFASKFKKPKLNSKIIFSHRNKILIKKITALVDSKYQVGGTVSWATSSHDIGLISKKQILGTLLK